MFQKAGDRRLNRSDHVWSARPGGWMCVLCGAVAKGTPPDYPTSGWMPETYEPLTDAERELGRDKRR